jgi:hypothetical protein
MAALMGPSGAGQLRQRQQTARLQSAIAGTHFYDLDAFYGALFSASRTDAAALPQNPATGTTLNPYTDLATQDGWDQVEAADAVYRERVIQLARAVSLGGTAPGLQAMAEAIVRVPCNVYEVWRLIDAQGSEGLNGNTWAELQIVFPEWSATDGETWDQMQGIVIYGGLGINARNEVIIQPQRTYNSDLASQQQAVSDASGIMDVVRVLAPAFALVSVDTTGALVDSPVTVAGLAADSDYWEVISKAALPTTPATSSSTAPSSPASSSAPSSASPYQGFFNAYDSGGIMQDPSQPMKPGVPPFSQSQGISYSYSSAVAQSFSSVLPGAAADASAFSGIMDLKNYQVVTFPAGPATSYAPAWGVTDPATAAAARAASAVSMTASPYSGARAPVVTAG